MKLIDAIRLTKSGFDIGDEDWDWGVYFECPEEEQDCTDSYSKVLYIIANSMEIIKLDQEWYSTCKVASWIKRHQFQIDEFLEAVSAEEFRPSYVGPLDDDSEEWYNYYMRVMEWIIAGSYSDADYDLLLEKIKR